jgi:signal transduction histidine kinase
LAAAPRPPERGREAGLPFLRGFTPREYGAGVQNWAIVQDPRGMIYVGNQDGVLEYDGVRWRLIPTAKRTAVRSLAVDGAGQVYVGAVGEFGRLAPDPSGRMAFVSLAGPLAPGDRDFSDVWNVHATRQGVFFSSYARLFRVAGDGIRVWRPETAFHLAFRVGERLFIREVDRGLLELVDGELRPVPGGDRFRREKIRAMLPGGPDGAILVGTADQGWLSWNGAAFAPFPTDADAALRDDLFYCAIRLSDGTLAIGTLQGGVVLLDPRGRFRGRLSQESAGLPLNTVYALSSDREGGLWLGLGSGLARAELPSPITRFDERTGLRENVLALHRHGGALYAGTYMGASRLETPPGRTAAFRPIQGIKGQCWAFLSLGDALLVSNNQGVYQIRGDRAELVRPSGQGSGPLLQDRTDPSRVFVGLQNGLASMRYQGGRWRDEGEVPGLHAETRTLSQAPDGHLWPGTHRTGVMRLTFPQGWQGGAGPGVERFGTAQGLPDAKDNRVFDLDGEILVATHQGFYRFDRTSGRFAPDPRFSGLFPDGPRWVLGVCKDTAGRLWMHTVDEGTGRHETGAAVPGLGGSWRWEPAPPLPATVADSDMCTQVDEDGVVWFGGVDGLFRYDPAIAHPRGEGDQAWVRSVLLPGGKVLFGGAATSPARPVPYRDNTLRFEFAAPGYDRPEANRFQVFLEGNDRDWSAWSPEAYKDYTNLHEGRYRFRVRARNVHDAPSREDAFPFRILPPWYRAWWAFLLYAASASGSLIMIHKARTGLLKARNRALQIRIDAATRELQAHEAQLEAQAADLGRMNGELLTLNEQKNQFLGIVAHDLRNPLNGIVLAAQLLDGEEDLSQISHTARLIEKEGLEMSSLIGRLLDIAAIESGRIKAEPDLFDLGEVARHIANRHAARAETKGITLAVALPPDPVLAFADLKFTREVLDNLVSNAVKFSAQGTAVKVRVEGGEGLSRISVQDQGPGLTEEDRQRLFGRFVRLSAQPTGGEKSTGLGLSIVKHMVDAMGGRIQVDSRPGQGATFTVELPGQVPA